MFEGEDALRQGIANLVTTRTGVNQFDSDKAIYLLTEFTGDASSFQFYFRRTSVALRSEELDSTDELNSDELEFKIKNAQLLVLIVVASVLLVLGIVICVKKRNE